MKLLICTQAVDLDDPVLGFFHSWVLEFAKHYERIDVICLKEGRYELPAHVFVHSLGKESGRSRVKYVLRFYRYIWRFRREYDSVFVHMNPEYVGLGGIFWRLWQKRIGLWYVHKRVSLHLRIASTFAHRVFTASRGSARLDASKVVVLGHGIDTSAFVPPTTTPSAGTILFLGRLDPVKKVEVFVEALQLLHEKEIPFTADMIGDPTDPKSNYAHDVRNAAASLALDGGVRMSGAVTNKEAGELYRTHAVYVNLTPSGSFDKTILEAMASGCICVAANEALRGIVPDQLLVDPDSPQSVADGIRAALALDESARREIRMRSRAYVEEHHALSRLIDRIVSSLAALAN